MVAGEGWKGRRSGVQGRNTEGEQAHAATAPTHHLLTSPRPALAQTELCRRCANCRGAHSAEVRTVQRVSPLQLAHRAPWRPGPPSQSRPGRSASWTPRCGSQTCAGRDAERVGQTRGGMGTWQRARALQARPNGRGSSGSAVHTGLVSWLDSLPQTHRPQPSPPLRALVPRDAAEASLALEQPAPAAS